MRSKIETNNNEDKKNNKISVITYLNSV